MNALMPRSTNQEHAEECLEQERVEERAEGRVEQEHAEERRLR